MLLFPCVVEQVLGVSACDAYRGHADHDEHVDHGGELDDEV